MKSREPSLSKNVLPPGITEQQLDLAVRRSGYPLQLSVASRLLSRFAVIEEWSFVDRTTQELRSLDIAASRQLHTSPANANKHIFPALELLIECKRSDMPFVFFKAATQPQLSDFPQIHGLRSKDIELIAQGLRFRCPTSKVLGLEESALVANGPPVCATFSKAVRAKKLELSGSDAFNGIILPLLGALDHGYREDVAPKTSQMYLPIARLAVCVLDAPMVLVDVAAGESSLAPWVRVIRHEVTARRTGVLGGSGTYVVDIIHSEFLDPFIDNYVLPLGELFKVRTEGRYLLLNNMTGHVGSLVDWKWDDVRDSSDA